MTNRFLSRPRFSADRTSVMQQRREELKLVPQLRGPKLSGMRAAAGLFRRSERPSRTIARKSDRPGRGGSRMAQMSHTVEHCWVVVPAVRSVLETAYGVRTHYLHAVEGEPVVLVHGGGPGASASSFAEVIPPLAERFSVFELDQIGNGDSDKPLIEYSPLTLVDHLAGFIDALDLKGVRLAGHSRGAYTVLRYALDFPHRVKQVVFSSA